MLTSASSRPPRPSPGRVRCLTGNRGGRHRACARHPGARAGRGRRADLARRQGAVARTAAGRPPRPARQLDLLLPARDVAAALGRALAAVLAVRPALSVVVAGAGRPARRVALAGVAPSVAPTNSAAGGSTIPVAGGGGARPARLRGLDLGIVPLRAGP